MNTLTLGCICLLVVATFFTTSASGYGFRLAQAVTCEGDQEFALHEDCTKYYICDNGMAILVECPPPLFFSLELGYCDFPANVPDCIGGTRDPGTGTEPTAPPSPTTEAPRTTVVETDAPSTQIQLSTTTEAAEETTEPPVKTTEPEPVLTTQASTVCPPQGIVFLPYPGSCKLYYICIHGEETVQECADGTLFDEELGRCNVAEEVDCQVVPTTEAPTNAPTTVPPTNAPTTVPPTNAPTTVPPTNAPTTEAPVVSTTTESSDVTCPAEGIDYLPDPTDCQKYYLCVNGEAIPEVCAEGLLFDPVTKQCEVAEDVDCVVEPQCPADEIAYLPVPGNCVEYILCVSGEAYPMECAAGTEFNPEDQECVLEESYECPVRKLSASASAFLRRLRH